MSHVLVVGDGPAVEPLCRTLRSSGLRVRRTPRGRRAILTAQRDSPDVIVVDLPEDSHATAGPGQFASLPRLRAACGAPVLVLSPWDTPADRVRGLVAGANDVIGKPYDLREVALRVQTAALTRAQARAAIPVPRAPGPAVQDPEPTAAPTEPEILTYADLSLDVGGHQVRRDGQLITLSPTEFRLLRYLMDNADRVISKAQILDTVWHHEPSSGGHLVESCIHALRSKIDKSYEKLIHTVRGVGYVLRTPIT